MHYAYILNGIYDYPTRIKSCQRGNIIRKEHESMGNLKKFSKSKEPCKIILDFALSENINGSTSGYQCLLAELNK